MSNIHHTPNPAQTPAEDEDDEWELLSIGDAPDTFVIDWFPLLSVSEVAKLVGVSESTVRRWIKSGQLRARDRSDPYGPATKNARPIGIRPVDLDYHIMKYIGWGSGQEIADTPASEYLYKKWARDDTPEPKFKPAQWMEDPAGRHELRYWDGEIWTFTVRDGDVEGEDITNLPDIPQILELSESELRGTPIDWEVQRREAAQVEALADQVFDLYVKRSQEGRTDDAQRALTILENLCQPVGMGGPTVGWRSRRNLHWYVHHDLLGRDPWPPPGAPAGWTTGCAGFCAGRRWPR